MTTTSARNLNGYDYRNQAWVVDNKYQRCGHPDAMPCKCFGRLHEGEPCLSDNEIAFAAAEIAAGGFDNIISDDVEQA